MVQIRQVNPQRAADVRAFVHFPFALYRDHPHWVPPLIFTVKRVLSRKHPFYRHSDAAFFLAEDERGEVVGRIAVLDNRHYNDYHRSATAFFYYFDAVDDVEVARALFEAAATWAGQRGLTDLVGPKGFLRSDGLGLLIEGFDYDPAPGIPYNYPYYARLLEALGFRKEIDYLSGYLEGDYDLPERFYRIAEGVKERWGFWIKSFRSKRELRAWAPHIQRVNNEAFTEIWGYHPLDEGETKMIADQLLLIADPRLIKVVMKGDEVAGFILVYPDITEGLRACKGRLWPFGWFHLLRAFKRTRKLSGNGLGLLPKYQGLGANAILYTELYKTVRQGDYDFCDIAQVAETNVKSLGEMRAIHVQWYKRHRIYRKLLTE